MAFANPANDPLTVRFTVADYDLPATLNSGQAFRWHFEDGAWEGVVAGRWLQARSEVGGLAVRAAQPQRSWDWLRHYLAVEENLRAMVASFPPDPPLQAAVVACRGLRLLRQEPWECLASFILSSTKQIPQIQQIVARLCERYGEPVAVPDEHRPEFAFPSAARLAACTEAELRDCRMGFRARYLRETAGRVAAGDPDLSTLASRSLPEAREALMSLPGVGRKIADCALLFSLGFSAAFPVDVWILKALRQLYFPRRRVTLRGLHAFTETHFGPYAGYAQQCLFHWMRQQAGRVT
ncbi:MAG: DNA-3-methyladenine glycosylase family protein [Limisphaerales bacterium]